LFLLCFFINTLGFQKSKTKSIFHAKFHFVFCNVLKAHKKALIMLYLASLDINNSCFFLGRLGRAGHHPPDLPPAQYRDAKLCHGAPQESVANLQI